MVMSILSDFGITGILLFLGYVLRKNIPVLQKLFLPASLIGGILGVLLGKNVLGTFCPVYLQFSEYIGQTALPLLACVFGMQMFMIKIDKEIAKNAIHQYALMSIAVLSQVIIGIFLVRGMMPGANDAYGLLPFTSFLGGPGVCAVVSGIVGEQANFSVETANSIGNTYATISIITGTIIGVLLINIARRRGALDKAGSISGMSEKDWTGFVPEAERVPAAYDVTNNNSTDTMSLQWAIAGVIIFVGFIFYNLITKVPALKGIVITVPVMISSFLVGKLFQLFKWDKYVDRKSLNHFGSIALDFMITSSIANTNLTIFKTHGTLILVTSVVVILWNILFIFGLSKLWSRSKWFMNGIGVFGVSNGVAATGLMLLRTADPNDNYGMIRNFSAGIVLLTSTTQLIYLNIIPMWISGNGNGVLLVTAAATVAFLIIGFAVGRVKTAE